MRVDRNLAGINSMNVRANSHSAFAKMLGNAWRGLDSL